MKKKKNGKAKTHFKYIYMDFKVRGAHDSLILELYMYISEREQRVHTTFSFFPFHSVYLKKEKCFIFIGWVVFFFCLFSSLLIVGVFRELWVFWLVCCDWTWQMFEIRYILLWAYDSWTIFYRHMCSHWLHRTSTYVVRCVTKVPHKNLKWNEAIDETNSTSRFAYNNNNNNNWVICLQVFSLAIFCSYFS